MKKLFKKSSAMAVLCIAALTLGGYVVQARELNNFTGSSSLSCISNKPAERVQMQPFSKKAASKFSDNDVKVLENSKYNGPFARVAGNRIYYYKTSKLVVNGHTYETGKRDKQESFLVNSKTIFILEVTHNHGMKVEKAKLGNINNLKTGCSVFAICNKQNGKLTASKVLIMTF